MKFTEEEKRKILYELQDAAASLLVAAAFVREKDGNGSSDLFTHIDSNYNDLTDTMAMLED